MRGRVTFRPSALEHFAQMPTNLKYAGPHDVAELLVDGDRYVAVAQDGANEDSLTAQGFTFDGDEAVERGLKLAYRTITVSDELAASLSRAGFAHPETGEFVASWPKAGGKAGAQTIDVPELNPSTRPVTLDDGTTITAAEANDRAYAAAEVDEVLERAEASAAEGAEVLTARNITDGPHVRIGQIDDRLAEVETALKAADTELPDDDVDKLLDEETRLRAERAQIKKALDAKGAK